MASQEMLKKLLEEFDEKEAQNREEINIVNLRIEELEKRITSSRLRLEKVGQDRQKVAEIMKRYSNGNLKNGTFVPANFPSAAATPAAATPSVATHAAATPAAATPAAATPATSAKAAVAGAGSASSASSPAVLPGAEPVVPSAEPWGIVKAAPPTPIIFDPSLPGGAAPAAPLPFSTPSASPQPFSSSPPSSAVAGGPSISAPVSTASTAPAVSKVASHSAPAAAPVASAHGAVQAPGEAPVETAQEGGSAGDSIAAGQAEPAAPASPAPASAQSSSPLSSLSAASLFASAPNPTTATGETSPFNLDTAASSGASPFAGGSPMHTTPLSTPQNAMPQSLMQSMPIGGAGNAASPAAAGSGAGKFDMMDLFAPLSSDEPEPSAEAPVKSEPVPEVAEQALAQNQFYSSQAPVAPAQVAQAAQSATDAAATGASAPATATQDHPSLDLGEDLAAQEAEEGDDTVKSINDALRGLFR